MSGTLLRAAICALLLSASAACSIEDPTYAVDAGATDAGTPDSGPEDAGDVEDCRDVPSVCAADEFCDAAGDCQARDQTCSRTSECGPDDVCLRPVVWTSTTVDAGRCTPHPLGCASDADCPSGSCWAIGICGPSAATADLEDRTLVPLASCTAASDCGLVGVCRDNACAGCLVNADCAGNLRCNEGACEEPIRCAGPEDCFAGNLCDGGRCLRDTSSCTPTPEDDGRSDPTPLDDGAYQGLTICGSEEDWYRLEVPVAEGVEVVLTSTPGVATLTATLETELGASPAGASRLELPGRTVLRVAAGVEQPLFLRVWSTDVGGAYDLFVRYRAGQCTTDPVEIYGPSVMVPTNVTFEGTVCPRTDERLGFRVEAGDRVEATATMSFIGTSTLSPAPVLAVIDATGAVVDPGLDVSDPATAVATAATNARPGAETLALRLGAQRIASAGSKYEMRLVRRLAGRAGACQTPVTLDPTGGPTSVQGDLTSTSDLGRPICSGVEDAPDFAAATRNDALYALRVPTEPVLLQATVRATAGTDPKLSVALLDDCNDDTSATACDTAPFARTDAFVQAVLTAGSTPTLVVSSDGEAEDVRFELIVEYISLTAFGDDVCASATPLVTTGTQTVYLYGADTFGARNDDTLWADRVTSACSAFGDEATGVDRYFSLSLNPGELAAVELTGPPGGMLWTGLACDDMPGTCQQADVRDFSSPVLRATFTASTSGTEHVVVVDGQTVEDQGTYVLRTVRNAQCLDDSYCQGPNLNVCGVSPCRCDDYRCSPAPTNDRCNGAAIGVGMSGVVALRGSTGAAADDYAPSCIGAGQPDVVYSVEVPAGTQELVARISEATFDPAIEIRQEVCPDSENTRVWCQDDVRLPDVLLPEVRVSEPEAGIYYIVVDSFAGEGAFTLEVEIL